MIHLYTIHVWSQIFNYCFEMNILKCLKCQLAPFDTTLPNHKQMDLLKKNIKMNLLFFNNNFLIQNKVFAQKVSIFLVLEVPWIFLEVPRTYSEVPNRRADQNKRAGLGKVPPCLLIY